MAKFDTVDEYLMSIDKTQAATLRRLIDFILSLDGELSVGISWNVPQIRLGKAYVFGMSAAKAHLTLAPWSATAFDASREALNDYVVNKGTFQVPDDWQIDERLIGDMVRMRLAEI